MALFVVLSTSASGQLEKVKSTYDLIQESSDGRIVPISFIHQEDSLVEDFNALSQIILVRHGEPALKKDGWRTRRGAMKFIRDYDSALVYEPKVVPVDLQHNDIQYLFTSELPRSTSTAEFLFPEQEKRPKATFNEFERKILSFYDINMPLKFWLNSSRLLWLVGVNNRGVESFRKAKQRAREAAMVLENDAATNGKTLLVSHGFLNHFLVRYLKKQGWIEVYDGGKGYLSQKMLIKL